MKALILAAGLGTRLRPATNHTPKPLIKVAGCTMLERTVGQLIKMNISQIAVNIFHLADKIEKYIVQDLAKKYHKTNFEIIREPELLETGGAIKNAEYFLKDSDPFLVHNVDILHTIDLNLMFREFEIQKPLTLLACARQNTSRPFLVDDQNNICGHRNKNNHQEVLARQPHGQLNEMRFCGIHLISSQIFDYLEQTYYSITPKYLELIEKGFIIKAFDIKNCFYTDIGTHEAIQQAEKILNN